MRVDLPDRRQAREAVHPPHLVIGDDSAVVPGLQGFQCGGAVGRGDHGVPGQAQCLGQGFAQRGVVFDEQDGMTRVHAA